MARSILRFTITTLLLLLPLFFAQTSPQPSEVLDVNGDPVRYGQDVFIIPLNSSLGGGFTFASYNFYDYILLSPGSVLQATAVRFGKANALVEDILYTGTQTFIYNSLSDWEGWNIWTVDVSRWRQNCIFLNNKRDLYGQFTVERAYDSKGYILKVCPSSEYCKPIELYSHGDTRWACADSSDDEGIVVAFTATRRVAR